MANYSTRLKAFRDSLESLSEIEKITITELGEDFIGLKGFIWCGIIAKFSITLDLSWKLMKDLLIEEHKVFNFAKGSPKEVLQKSYEANIISEHTWAEMLQVRNEISHQYKNLEIVDEWCEKIITTYIPLFYGLLKYAEGLANEHKQKQ
ncbi:MAG: nucleotidyltransferase substrate binding protein [Oscillospiraceae bacterium]|nr:nucleotidyltransferase substrate binding protein [Oscillospiraceae bacterium]